jgi:hypothetical protein
MGERRDFLFSVVTRQALGPTQFLVPMGTEAISLLVKQTERESDYSPPSVADVKNTKSITPLSHMSS